MRAMPSATVSCANDSDRLRARQQGAAGALVDAPFAGGRHVHLGVGVGQALVVVGQEVAALGCRQMSR